MIAWRESCAAALLILAGCGQMDHRGESYSRYYGGTARETVSENVERKRLVTWGQDPRLRRRIGILERERMKLEGTRDWREYYFILDPGGTRKLGFVNESGEFYRYDAKGALARVGEYKIMETGLKIFFGLALSDPLELEPVDPYKDQ